MKLSVVMPCHNRLNALNLTLDSLTNQTFPAEDFEVIVVDQASTDGSRQLVLGYKTPFTLRLLEQDQKYGISVARNAGIAAAHSNLILILDADLIADPHLLESHYTFHLKNPDALLCGRVKPYFPAYQTYTEEVANPDDGLDRGPEIEDLPFYQGFGGHMVLTKIAFQKIGPFDPRMVGYEDIDFAQRAIQSGYKIFNNPQAVSFHNHSRTISERLAQARKYNQMLPVLLERYPQYKGQIIIFQDLEPVNVYCDSPTRLIKKLLVRFYSIRLVQKFFLSLLMILDRKRQMPRLVRFLFWRLLIGSWYLGFKDGTAALRDPDIRDSFLTSTI
jgi:glycosyltransferase involved in cell wall biosynthesis